MDLHLKACPEFWYASDNYIKTCYNGVGNEALPVEVRKILTKLTRFFTDLPFMIHDFEFQHLPKTKKNFHLANKHLKNNLRKILDWKLPREQKKSWWNILSLFRRLRRKFYLQEIRVIYHACEDWGWGAFKKAGDEDV